MPLGTAARRAPRNLHFQSVQLWGQRLLLANLTLHTSDPEEVQLLNWLHWIRQSRSLEASLLILDCVTFELASKPQLPYPRRGPEVASHFSGDECQLTRVLFSGLGAQYETKTPILLELAF